MSILTLENDIDFFVCTLSSYPESTALLVNSELDTKITLLHLRKTEQQSNVSQWTNISFVFKTQLLTTYVSAYSSPRDYFPLNGIYLQELHIIIYDNESNV